MMKESPKILSFSFPLSLAVVEFPAYCSTCRPVTGSPAGRGWSMAKGRLPGKWRDGRMRETLEIYSEDQDLSEED